MLHEIIEQYIKKRLRVMDIDLFNNVINKPIRRKVSLNEFNTFVKSCVVPRGHIVALQECKNETMYGHWNELNREYNENEKKEKEKIKKELENKNLTLF